MTETERKILETEPRSMPDHAARFSVRYKILTRDQGMRPDEAVMKALEDEGMREHVDAEKLVELMMRQAGEKSAAKPSVGEKAVS